MWRPGLLSSSPKMLRKDYAVAMNLTGNSLDDPDQNFFENFLCGGPGNIDGYCNPEVEKLMIRAASSFG